MDVVATGTVVKSKKDSKIKKIIAALFISASLASAGNVSNCSWAQKEVNILTKELQYNIANGTKKSKQDTFNNLADVVQYELIPDCKGIVENSVLMEVVNGLHSIKQRAIREGWWN